MRARLLPAILLLIASLGTTVHGAESGKVKGRVVDKDGAVVGATVELIPEGAAQGTGARSDADGLFTFEGVAAGRYTVRAALAGGEPISSAPFQVKAGEVMELAPLSLMVESVEVQASPD